MQELNDYLDDVVDVTLRKHIEAHITQCPNCFVILDTTKKTIQVYKGMQPQTLPGDVSSRLNKAVERMLAQKKAGQAH